MVQFLSSPRRQFVTGLVGTSLLLFGGWQLWKYVSENGWMSLFHPAQPQISTVHLKAQPLYQIKKKQELFGVEVIRIISTHQPEEFLVLDHVPKGLVDSIYQKPVNLVWANTVANQFTKLRQNSDEDTPASVDIQDIKTLKSGILKQAGQELPYWQIEIRFKLSNEQVPRYYSAGVVRQLHLGTQPDKESLVVGYAQKGAYQSELVADLLDNLHFGPGEQTANTTEDVRI